MQACMQTEQPNHICQGIGDAQSGLYAIGATGTGPSSCGMGSTSSHSEESKSIAVSISASLQHAHHNNRAATTLPAATQPCSGGDHGAKAGDIKTRFYVTFNTGLPCQLCRRRASRKETCGRVRNRAGSSLLSRLFQGCCIHTASGGGEVWGPSGHHTERLAQQTTATDCRNWALFPPACSPPAAARAA